MSKCNTLEMLIGLPGSGKSTWANHTHLDSALLVSSDAIREELGDINDQENNDAVFELYYKRAKEALKSGKDVILDATNLTIKSRRNAIEQLGKYATGVVAHYFNVSYEECLFRNATRERRVPEHVISLMHKNMQVPTYAEGFDNIVFHNQFEKMDKDKIEGSFFHITTLAEIEESIYSPQTYENIMGGNPYWGNVLEPIWELPQDNSYHAFSVSRHTYYVWKHILENYDGKDKLAMLWAGLLHDVGKAFCKRFRKIKDKDGNETISRYASFIGHENVSAQLAAHLLSQYYDTDFVLKVVEIIQFHMRLMQIEGDSNGKPYKKLYKLLGDDLMTKLEFFYEADTNAK